MISLGTHPAMTTKCRTYNSWHAMKARCQRPADKQYADYGGRGIKVCERWQKYANFLADMGERPEGKELDRINNDGNYEPGNCRWATRFEQQENTSRSKLIEFNGVKRTLRAWARTLGFSKSGLQRRLKKMPVQEAFTKPKETPIWAKV